jgi:hypothetical protein
LFRSFILFDHRISLPQFSFDAVDQDLIERAAALLRTDEKALLFLGGKALRKRGLQAAARIKAGMTPFTGHTIVIPRMFVEELARVRERGYAISIDESEIGLSSIGVPIRDQPDGEVIAAMSTAGPTGRLLGDHESHHVRLMLNAARQITNSLAAGAYSLPRQRRTAR